MAARVWRQWPGPLPPLPQAPRRPPQFCQFHYVGSWRFLRVLIDSMEADSPEQLDGCLIEILRRCTACNAVVTSANSSIRANNRRAGSYVAVAAGLMARYSQVPRNCEANENDRSCRDITAMWRP